MVKKKIKDYLFLIICIIITFFCLTFFIISDENTNNIKYQDNEVFFDDIKQIINYIKILKMDKNDKDTLIKRLEITEKYFILCPKINE